MVRSLASVAVVLGLAGAASAQLVGYGITTDNRLVSFNPAAPGMLASTVAISGLGSSESVLGIDVRPLTGELIVITSTNRLMSVGLDGTATAIGGGFTPALTTLQFGMDFNPTVDRIRVVNSDGGNRRLNPLTGGNAATDTGLTFSGGQGTPRAVATAYTNALFGANVPLGSVRQFILDSDRNILGEVGSQAGGNASFNGGVVTQIGTGLGFDLSDIAGFDIFGPTGQAFISSGDGLSATTLYSLDLGTGAATAIGAIGDGSLGQRVVDFTIVPAPSAAGVLALAGVLAARRRRA